MLDNQLIAIFRPLIISELAVRGITGVAVKQDYQPTQQGADTNAAVYFHKISDHRYGFLHRGAFWDESSATLKLKQVQAYETVFQISTWVRQVPQAVVDYTQLTASDLANTVAEILQSSVALTTLQAQGVGIYRVQEVRNPYFVDDRGQFEAAPSFDFTLTHEQVYITNVNSLSEIDISIYEIP